MKGTLITAQDKNAIGELADLNLISQSQVDFHGQQAVLNTYTFAPILEDGTIDWDDGQRWAVTLETDDGTYLLFHQYVQLGKVEADAMLHQDGSTWKTVVRVNRNAGDNVYEYIFDQAGQGFMEKVF